MPCAFLFLPVPFFYLLLISLHLLLLRADDEVAVITGRPPAYSDCQNTVIDRAVPVTSERT